MHQNQAIKKEIAKRNSRAKNRFPTSRYLSKTMPIKTNRTSTARSSNRIRDPLIQIRIKHGSLTISSAQNEIKIKICNAMSQLNDIDSRGVGLSVLQSIVNTIPEKLILLIIEPFFCINNDLKALCRKELALLIGYIGSKRGNTPLFYKYLARLLNNLCKRAQDCDSRVREACGDSFGRISKQCIRYTDNQSNTNKCNEVIHKIMKPIIKHIEKCISPHSVTGNFLCLSHVILSADNYLNLQHIIVICKCIISNIINIRDTKTHCALLICIEKLMIVAAPLISSTTNKNNNNNTDYFSALLAIIIDGLSNNDWNIRNYSLKAIYAVGVIFVNIKNKPEINKNKIEIVAHLQRLKYDKISNVRNAAIMTLSVWNDIANLNENDEQNQESIELHNNTQNNDDIDDEDIELDLRTKEITEQPWFDKKDDEANTNNVGKNADSNDPEVPVKDIVEDNSNALLLQQQQLMLKTIKNLESYIHREVGNIKSRIHSVERDMQRFKVLYQNNEWMNDNKKVNRQLQIKDDDKTITYDDADIDDESTEIKENEENVENTNNTTLNVSETISIYSDETRIIDLNEQLLNTIQMDNNTELIRWLVQNNNYHLFQLIDERLMISLIYRITQLLKNKTYINDICDFLKKEFVTGAHTIPKSFSLPNQLKIEFLNTIKEHENVEQFISKISELV